jgi:hypothetical protein
MYVVTALKTRSADARTITNAQILWLRDKAFLAGDSALVDFCDLALRSTLILAKERGTSVDRAWGLRAAARRGCAASLNALRARNGSS